MVIISSHMLPNFGKSMLWSHLEQLKFIELTVRGTAQSRKHISSLNRTESIS